MAVIVAGLGCGRWGRIVYTHAAVHVETLVTNTVAQISTGKGSDKDVEM